MMFRSGSFLTLLIFVAGLAAPSMAQVQSDGEPPMFSIDHNATGPLTLDELDIHFPEYLKTTTSPRERACMVEEIGRLAAEAGDPVAPDTTEVRYLSEIDDWDRLSRRAQRAILAQAIFSQAAFACL